MRKVTDHGFSEDRAREKLGFATLERPAGTVVWFHAASVGESMSVLALIHRLGERLPDASFLVTSGTPTSAEIIAKRLPPRACHQFAPLDAPAPVSRFLKHWKPSAGVFVESELWPQVLVRARSANVPLALVNARLSEGSLRQWRRFSKTAQQVFGVFSLITTQSDAMTEALCDIGAPDGVVKTGANLKALATPLPVDETLTRAMRSDLDGHPVWVAASTHKGEEDIVLDAHKRALKRHPDLKLILVPRHPERGDDVAHRIHERGWPAPRRSLGDKPNGSVYLADTVGELGSWYALANCVFLGGSLFPIGGHNPFEPALSGLAICSGPHVANFQTTYDDMQSENAVAFVDDAQNLADQICDWFSAPAILEQAQQAAKAFSDGQSGALDDIATDLIKALKLHHA